MDFFGFSANVCGIVYPGAEHVEACLPLERADVHANVIDVSAIVTFTQHFWQHDPAGLQRAKYVFPVPARAAVCGFEMTTEKGGVIVAIAKEKGEARREHDQAISDGFFTGLVEHVTDDIFSISLGALPGLQMLQTKVTYVLDLMDADVVDQVRLQIPVHIGMRYGSVPEGMQAASQVPSSRINISADVRMQGAITSITSPTHPSVLVSDSTTPSVQQTATYISPDFLSQDFVLSIKAAGLDAPRCFAQRTAAGVTALQLSVVPQFHLPPVPRQEYVFVVDRSGSMEGGRIATARKALVMLLRALPTQGTYFNIFSFGSHCDSLWTQSVPYNAETLDQATRHVDSMQADYGGTEIQNALSMAIESRKTDIPTAYFILTDGESYNTAHTISTVEKAVQSAATEAPLRVFTLGIGSTTSSELCEGVARAGNGICLMTTTAEGIVGKCAKLVRASRTYILKKASVDWGAHILPAAVRQAPTQLPPLYPGTRFVVFALIDDPAYTLPNAVVIRAQRDGQGEPLQLSVPVQTVEFPDGHPHARLVPTLAARRAIMDLEDAARKTRDVDHKSAIVELGTTYQLVSKYTSFVAVDKNTRTDILNDAAHTESTERVSPGPMSLAQYAAAWGAAQTLPILMEESHDDDDDSDAGPTIWAKAPPPQLCAAPSPSAVAPLRLPVRARSAAPPSPPSPMSVDVSPASEACVAPPAPSGGPGDDSEEEDWCEASFSDQFDISAVPTLYAPAPKPAPEDDKVFALVRLQAFDGSFPAGQALEEIFGSACLGEAQGLQVDEKAWATALAVVFLRKHMQDEPELLDGLVEKAMEYLGQFPGLDFDALLVRAGHYIP